MAALLGLGTLREHWNDLLSPFMGNQTDGSYLEPALLLLAIIQTKFPQANLDYIAACMYVFTGEVVSPQEIVQRKMELLRRPHKRALERALTALTPENVRRAELFWIRPPPLGVVMVRRKQLIDCGVCILTLETTMDPSGLQSVIHSQRPPKSKHCASDQQIMLFLAIEPGDPALPAAVSGSVNNPRRWFRTYLNPRESAVNYFADFCETVCRTCELSGLAVDANRVFMWDEHHFITPYRGGLVYNTIIGRGLPQRFRIVPRPSFRPGCSPTEFAFAELARHLQKMVQPHWTLSDLEHHANTVCSAICSDGRFDYIFDYCGYNV